MTTATVGAQTPGVLAGPRRVKRVAIMPAYNEAATVVAVLERLRPLSDELIIVDDGSTDNTRELVLAWAKAYPEVRLICFNQNRGMSAAYYRAFQEVARRVDSGDLGPDDVILTVDADGQHDPEEVDELLDYMRAQRLDAVIARRDLSSYTLYKRLGNFLISLWASFWAGLRLYDVESGYRAFRAGALLTALQYYKGYRYSETVEVAVILARLSYRVDNNYLVPVPVYRSNTRLRDLAIDIAAMPAAAWRLEAKRRAPFGQHSSAVYYLPVLVPLLLGIMCLSVLVRGLFLADDSMQQYSHVWYFATQFFHHGRLPLHFAGLDGGHAMTFPYALVPYLATAVLFPILGDWAVTLAMVTGVVALVWVAGLARPAMRNPWLLVFFVINPFFIESLYSFQFATVWSYVFFLLFVWSFEAKRVVPSVALLWLSLTSHPAMGLSGLLLYAGYVFFARRDEVGRLALASGVAVLAASPVVYMTLQTPALGENRLLSMLSLADSMVRRGTMVAIPLAAPYLQSFVLKHYGRSLAFVGVFSIAALAFTGGLFPLGDLNRGSYSGVFHQSHDIYAGFFASDAFIPGSTYRVMERTDREDGLYRFLQHGAISSNEFFGESYERRNWTESQFACYAAYKQIDYEVIESSYEARYHKNESTLLDSLVQRGAVKVAYRDPQDRFVVYDVRPLVASTSRPTRFSQCSL